MINASPQTPKPSFGQRLGKWIPGVTAIRHYQRGWLPRDLERYPDAQLTPGLLMIRWDAPLIFANSNLFRNFVRGQIARTEPTPFWVLVAAEPITDVDTSAADMLVDLDEELNAAGIHLILAELKDPVRDKIERYGLYDTIDRRHFYPTIEVAIEEFHLEWSARESQE
jgi:MFS superfamily sulfate permease-like transporter